MPVLIIMIHIMINKSIFMVFKLFKQKHWESHRCSLISLDLINVLYLFFIFGNYTYQVVLDQTDTSVTRFTQSEANYTCYN